MSNGTRSPDSIRKLDHEEPPGEENDIEVALDAIPALLDKIEHDLKVNLTLDKGYESCSTTQHYYTLEWAVSMPRFH